MNKQIVVTDWIKEKPRLGSFLKLTLSSDERRILRGKKLTDCDQEIILQLPRKGKLNDGDILSTNESNFCLLYTSPSPRDNTTSRMPSSA